MTAKFRLAAITSLFKEDEDLSGNDLLYSYIIMSTKFFEDSVQLQLARQALSHWGNGLGSMLACAWYIQKC